MSEMLRVSFVLATGHGHRTVPVLPTGRSGRNRRIRSTRRRIAQETDPSVSPLLVGLLSLDDRPWGKYDEPRWYSSDSRVRLCQDREYLFHTTGLLHRRCVLVDVKSRQTVRTAESRSSWRILGDAWSIDLSPGPSCLDMYSSSDRYFLRHRGNIVAKIQDQALFRCPTRWCVYGQESLNEIDLLFLALVCRRSRGRVPEGPRHGPPAL